MEKHKALNDLQAIRQIMQKSQRFLSLSALSSTLSGIYAILGSMVAYRISKTSDSIIYKDILNGVMSEGVIKLLMIAMVVFILAAVTGLYMSSRMAKQSGESLWSPSAINLSKHFALPFSVGIIFCLICVVKGYLFILAPASLIFYGLSLWSAGSYTFSTVRILGIYEIILGLISFAFIGYGIIFWVLGFGVGHILYGIYHYLKFEKS